MNTDWLQTSELPWDYLDVMLPELLNTGLISSDAHKQVLDVLGNQGFKPAIKTLWILLTINSL